mgnify:CR=1 FL=1
MAGKTRISFTQGCIAPSLFEFGTVVLEKKIPAVLERGKKNVKVYDSDRKIPNDRLRWANMTCEPAYVLILCLKTANIP